MTVAIHAPIVASYIPYCSPEVIKIKLSTIFTIVDKNNNTENSVVFF